MDKQTDWFHAQYSETAHLSLRIKEHLYSTRSPYQKIDVFDSYDFGRVLVLDDIINVTERDEYIYHEMLTHVPLFVQPEPKSVLVVGGGDGGVIREVMKHSCVERALMIEIDAAVIEAAKQYFPAVSCGLHDSRVEVITADASAYIAHTKQAYDVIIVDSTDPIGAGLRLFTHDFYNNCLEALTADGVLTAQSESPFFDLDIVQRLYATARDIFPFVTMYIAFMPSYVSGIWSFLFCSRGTDPVRHFQHERYHHSGITANYYNQNIHTSAFTLPTFIKKQFNL
ncbi:polyamine aminopropyltransferase [Thermodesulfobacteriota bacterium]